MNEFKLCAGLTVYETPSEKLLDALYELRERYHFDTCDQHHDEQFDGLIEIIYNEIGMVKVK